MVAIALALISSLSWGFADFLAGMKSRRVSVLTVLVFSQAAGLVLIGALVAVRGQPPPAASFVLYAVLAGLAGIAGLAAFYRGLTVGAMSVVAPISATAATIPLTVGVVTGDRLTGPQSIGIALALAGVVLVSRTTSNRTNSNSRVAAGVGLALIAAVGFGCFLLSMDAASDADFLWAVLIARSSAVALCTTAALGLGTRLADGLALTPSLVAIGTLDVTANIAFAAASTKGLVSLVSVIASLYPVPAVILAYILLGERIGRGQKIGVVSVLAGVAVISSG